MLSVQIICIGKLKEDYLKSACAEYIKRISAFAKISVIELNEYKLPSNPSEAQITQCILREGEDILSKIQPKSYTISMCIEGKMVDSVELSKKINGITLSGVSTVNFVIGGSYGLSDAVKQKSDFRLSMSPMTFPHQLARVMLLEQIYRSFQINSNGKYHK